MEPGSRNITPEAKAKRMRLRESASVAERVFWEAVRKDKLGYRVRRQVSVGPYTLDFYIVAAQLNVELDGEQHAERREADRRRDEYLASCGITVLRIPTLELLDETGVMNGRWMERVQHLVDQRVRMLGAERAQRRAG